VLVLGALLAALIAAAPASAQTFTQNTDIIKPPSGLANPYPSEIPVRGLHGLVTDVNVRVDNPDYDHTDDLDVIVVSPDGDAVYLMSDACGTFTTPTGTEFVFDQAAPNAIPDEGECTGGPYKPANYEGLTGESGTYPFDFGQVTLDAFNGENPNGVWQLYVKDDADESGDPGAATIGSWSLDLTVGSSLIHIPAGPADTTTLADPYPSELELIGAGGTVITDVNVLLQGLSHDRPQDVDMFLEGPGGQRSWLISDVCGGPSRWSAQSFVLDDEAASVFPESPGEEPDCDVSPRKPTNYEGTPPDDFPAPAPAKPAAEATALSTFDLTDPEGTWKLWAVTDNEGTTGFMDGWDLQIETRPAAGVGFAVGAQTVNEGSTVTVDVVRTNVVGGLGRGTVVVATQSDSAEAGKDFVPVSDTITFEPGETVKSISVPVLRDRGGERDEAFSIALSGPTGDAFVATPAAIGVTITGDPDQPVDDTPKGNEDKPAPAVFDKTNSLTKTPSTRRCRRKGQTIRFRPVMPAGIAIVRSELFVNGKKIEDNIGEAAVAPIVVTMTRGKKMKIRIKLYSHDGRVVTIRKTFRRCGKRARG
jgi:subtilisin-like proprotein convertase family protein